MNVSLNQSLQILFALAILLVAVVLPVSGDECVLKSRVSDFPPQYYKSEFGEWHGMGVELTRVLVDESGCQVKFVEGPWFRSLLEMRSGDLDIMMNLSITEERKEFMHFIGPMRDETILLATKGESNFEYQKLDDFLKLKKPVGILKGAYYGQAFQERFDADPVFKSQFSQIAKNELMMQMLNRGRLSGLLEDKYSLIWMKRNLKPSAEFQFHSVPVNQDWVYFGLSKKSVSNKLLARLRDAYQRAKQNGNFKKIMNRYSQL